MFATLNDTMTRIVIGTFGTALCAGACLFGAAAPAVAAPAESTRVVHYADLNLASEAGRDTLHLRITQAARAVCATGLRDVRSQTDERRCIKSAVEAASNAARPSIASNDING